MPYSSNSNLPPAVRKLSSRAQTAWRKAFNAAYKTYGETRAFKIAWAAIKRLRQKVKGFEPPASGSLPEKGKKVLAAVYSDCRSKWVKTHPDDKENKANKESCAKQAWAAVRKAGFQKKVTGFVPDIQLLGNDIWQAKISDVDVVYPTNMYGEVRFCPRSYEGCLPSAVGKPVTLNHTEAVVGIVIDQWVEDNIPWLKWAITDPTISEMMSAEGWTGGVSPSVIPQKIVDGLMVDWDFDSLGVGDGSMRPA